MFERESQDKDLVEGGIKRTPDEEELLLSSNATDTGGPQPVPFA